MIIATVTADLEIPEHTGVGLEDTDLVASETKGNLEIANGLFQFGRFNTDNIKIDMKKG